MAAGQAVEDLLHTEKAGQEAGVVRVVGVLPGGGAGVIKQGGVARPAVGMSALEEETAGQACNTSCSLPSD